MIMGLVPARRPSLDSALQSTVIYDSMALSGRALDEAPEYESGTWECYNRCSLPVQGHHLSEIRIPRIPSRELD